MKNIKTHILLMALATTLTFASKTEQCDNALHFGVLQESAAAKDFHKSDFIGGYDHLKAALFNYAKGFKPCMNTDRETELLNSSARVNGILTKKEFRQTLILTKYIKETL